MCSEISIANCNNVYLETIVLLHKAVSLVLPDEFWIRFEHTVLHQY